MIHPPCADRLPLASPSHPALPLTDLTDLSVADLKRRLQPGTRYHLTYRIGSAGPLAFESDETPGREVLNVQSKQIRSLVIGGKETWLTLPVFKDGDTLHTTPRGFQFTLARSDITLRFEWGDAPAGARVNRPEAATPQVPEIELERVGGGLSVNNVYHHPRFTLRFGGYDAALLQYVPDRTWDPEQTGEWALHRKGMTLRFPEAVRTFEDTRTWLLGKPPELLAFLKAE